MIGIPHKRYRFGDCELDPAGFQVFRSGKAVSLEPRAVQVLQLLIEQRGRMVSKEELFEKVWGETFVTDNALTRVIAQLRKGLGDNAKQARYIETVPTQGYRFIAEVSEAEGRAGNGGKADVRKNRRVAAALIVVPALVLMLGGVIWRSSGRMVPARLPGTLRTLQLTTSAGLEHGPSFSPDGSNVAYASDAGGSFEIYVRGVAAGGRQLQVTRDGGQNIQPSFSPSGEEIAYYSAGKNAILVTPALGGFARMVSDFGCEPAWSPDGQRIAFRSGGFISLGTPEIVPPANSRLWVVPAKGGKPVQVTRDGQPPGRHGRPSWSPDGRKLIFASYGPVSTLWTVEVATGKLENVGLREGVYVHPIYAPDGSGSIFYTGVTQDLEFGIWRYRPGRGEPPLELQRTGVAMPVNLAITADGRRLSYGLIRMTSNLAALTVADRSGETVGAVQMLTADTSFRNTFPAVSPDGSRIAFHVRRQGVASDMYVMNSDGAQVTQVTRNPEPDLMPNWTPDGESLVYSSGRGGSNTLWRLRLDTGQEQAVLNTPIEKVMARLSADGREIVFHRAEAGLLTLWKLKLGGGEPVRMSGKGESVGYPNFSRDGAWIAAERMSGDYAQVVVIPSAGGEARQLTQKPGQHWPYSWSPDSRRIAMAAQREGVWNLSWLEPSTGRQHQLTHNTQMRVFLRYPDWSPAGGRIVFEHAETRGNLFLLQLR
ncbi:MAG: hypothetical protein FJW20_03275 [Acidimicrobiia bacterium]|nr:hypothetical protein [Acidimicrobiia bacterium]